MHSPVLGNTQQNVAKLVGFITDSGDHSAFQNMTFFAIYQEEKNIPRNSIRETYFIMTNVKDNDA